mmetsp:Transcript_28711/g.80821  ORF Transcript_28711/g.80821 Transcript_28711/m.80821 type:complete len:192 (+) Transcript_28711:105-680(+)|eukprot:CAMPEP_0117677364 /NCGR_PEP_ID=MMETSP0804-20121206/16705_1 /TAXON_ID=1074897 /ORGANISM="Tetraselmis astigmatica, Strain CCMP880" /LENGTH=191 /DNA_ID=CAMNT_0005486641 /DNA_START=72 /DNA_END=647 /DNA_ORIENTATION=+
MSRSMSLARSSLGLSSHGLAAARSRTRGVPSLCLSRATSRPRGLSPQLPSSARGQLPSTLAKASSEPSQQVSSLVEEQIETAAARTRYSVTLRKPLGLVLEEDKAGNILVAEVVPEGNADKSGVISEGDKLIATSGYVYTTENQYTGNTVRGGEQLVKMTVKGEKFDTVMAAIGSHPGHIKVQLELERAAK